MSPEDKQVYERLAAFRYLLRRLLRHSEENARATGLTPQQYQLLLAIAGQPGRDWASVGELAEYLQITAHAAVGLVRRCALAGLVRREADPDDRRAARIFLTAMGTNCLAGTALQGKEELGVVRAHLRPHSEQQRHDGAHSDEVAIFPFALPSLPADSGAASPTNKKRKNAPRTAQRRQRSEPLWSLLLLPVISMAGLYSDSFCMVPL